MTIWAIPGFLGQPTDWDFWPLQSLIGVDWQMFSWESLPDWATQFNQWVQPQATNILMGYSLGGRLALHALIDKPQQWQAAILIYVYWACRSSG